MSKQPAFKTRARVINQLGEQLIKNEAIALLELIKNSYDADSSKCQVTMIDPDSKNKGVITIIDDGEGMNYETLIKAWLEIGTSHKEDIRNTSENKRTKKYKRLRLGEKGIGRFGVHRLGEVVKITTRGLNEKQVICNTETILTIDWNTVENSRYIENIPVKIEQRKPKTFMKCTGTKIVITDLKRSWDKKLARECARSITSLNSPFESNDSFRVTFEIKNLDWLDGLISYDDIEEYKLFDFDIELSRNEITAFQYNFTPWDTMKKLSARIVTLNDPDIQNLSRMQYRDGRDYRDINISKYKIGKIRFKGVIFDRDTRTMALGVQDKAGLKKYLDTNGGIQVFRDNMRVLNYGEPGDDWLDLSGRRVNMPTKRISKNIILGAVYLNRDTSSDLQEKANREGFVENSAYWELWRALRFSIDRVESLRKTDKDLLRKYYGPQELAEPVITSITELKDIIDHNVKSESAKKEIHKYLDRIEEEYESITTSLMKSAGAGLNLIIVIHQIGKIIKELKQMIKQKAEDKILEERIATLAALVEGYSILVKKSEKKLRNLKGVVEKCVFNIEFRLDAHRIILNPEFRKKNKDLDAICSEDHVLNALMNLFDNSIWWLAYAKTKNPSIWLNISNELKGYTSIIIADNGPGFTKPTDEIVKPFVSDKPGGMGIGLHLTEQIMESLDGKLLFPGMEIYNIPKQYKNGAIIALAFKKGRK